MTSIRYPAHWTCQKLKHVASLRSGESITSNDISDSGEYPVYGGNGVRGYTSSHTHEGEYPLIGRQGALCGNINYASGKFWASEHAVVVHVREGHVVRWLGEVLRSMDLNQYSQSAAQPGISVEVIENLPIPVPPEFEQEVIAAYLDRETARIDRLIAAKERMLALLEEKRAALISRVVTRGLDPDAPLKPSGQEWLGEIPAHWHVERAKNLFTVRDERSDDGTEELLTVSHITGVTSRSEKDVYMFEADDKAGYKRCMRGDLAINTLWAWMGAMGISPLEGIVSPDYHVYTSKGELLPEYVDLLCRSRPFVAEVNRWSKGVWSSRLRLYPENFFEMRLPVPPHDEQLEIVRSIETDQYRVSALRDSLQLSIALAKERRAALITAAVTGQLSLEAMTR
ncbi:restriction endonuclease subunit S [Thauera sp. SWB20]|uniref:restriction endonuclease subunit S n=1 Tax=Thauera sp. SWB20 TaxID=1572758 RepID=UPI0005ADC210|nr:restriction endonuclease subunit S [Thauera sp. SWB20]KIN90058.1 type I restriction modification DNA specificity domain protein [Thauera sp. SWB20]